MTRIADTATTITTKIAIKTCDIREKQIHRPAVLDMWYALGAIMTQVLLDSCVNVTPRAPNEQVCFCHLSVVNRTHSKLPQEKHETREKERAPFVCSLHALQFSY